MHTSVDIPCLENRGRLAVKPIVRARLFLTHRRSLPEYPPPRRLPGVSDSPHTIADTRPTITGTASAILHAAQPCR